MNKWMPLMFLTVAFGAAGLVAIVLRPKFPADRWRKKPLRGDKAKWLADLVPRVRPVIAAHGLPLSVAIAQAALETGWGRAGRANPWGLRGSGDAGSDFINTHEVIDGVKIKQTGQKFARFSSVEAAANGYARFLDGKRYRRGHAYRASDPGAWLLWLWGQGYATATRYAQAAVDVSRKVAVTLDDPSLAIPWNDNHARIAEALSAQPAGRKRRALTDELLGPAQGQV